MRTHGSPQRTRPHPAPARKRLDWHAVLELYVRSLILRQQGKMDAEMKTRFTCNQFLSCHGNPTAVEADIGVIYQREGLDAAFAWIRENLEPLFLKQEAKRKRTGK